MTSRLDDFVTAIASRFDDGTVNFVAGKLNLNKHATQRQAIFTRQSGVLTFSSSPGRTPFGTVSMGQGTFTQQRFQRAETVEVTLRAADEEALDVLFDKFVNVVFEECGPNAFDDANPYEWVGEDSKNASAWDSRNPGIKFTLNVRLSSRSEPKPYAVLSTTETEVTEGDETVTVTVPAP